jgi:glycosyltransferase involved in cell wall biosynthesis
MTASPAPKFCVLLPAYREAAHVGGVVREIKGYASDVIVIDDGSPDDTAGEAERAGALVLAHVRNQGKGAAIRTGIRHALEHGYDLALTMDADGQHAPSDIPAFLAAYARTRNPALVGNRMGDTSTMPWIRLRTNRFMSNLLSRVMGQYVPDTQCGFRLYDRSVFPLFEADNSARYAAESEILLRISLEGRKIGAVTIQTIYGTERSKVNPFTDTIRFFRMLRRFKKIRKQWEKNR